MESSNPITGPFKKWVRTVIPKIVQSGLYKLEGDLRTAIKQEADLARDAYNNSRHETLVELFEQHVVVYIALILYKENKLLIKIGSTNNMHDECFEQMKFTHVYPCSNNELFTTYLHQHKTIARFATDQSTFIVSQAELDSIVNVMKYNVARFHDKDNAMTALESQRLALERDRELLERLKQQRSSATISEVFLAPQVAAYKQSRGHKVQRYSRDGSELLHTYQGITDAIRDPILTNASGLSESIVKCTLYKGYRWTNLDRELDDSTIQTLALTVDQTEIHTGYVAMLDLEKTCIVSVFQDQKAAALDRKFSSSASISSAIRLQRKSGGHYFVMYDDCDQALKDAFLKNHTLPPPAKRTNSQSIDQLHPITNQLIQTFASISDVQKALHLSRRSIAKALEEGGIVKGYRLRSNT